MTQLTKLQRHPQVRTHGSIHCLTVFEYLFEVCVIGIKDIFECFMMVLNYRSATLKPRYFICRSIFAISELRKRRVQGHCAAYHFRVFNCL